MGAADPPWAGGHAVDHEWGISSVPRSDTRPEVFDVSGAGDTVIAACLSAIASGASPHEAAILANVTAGVVVGRLGTALYTREDLLGQL